MSAPRRWKELDSGASPELRAVLQHAQAQGPDAAQIAALTSAVLAELPAALSAQPEAHASNLPGAATTAPAVAGKLAAGGAVGATLAKVLALAVACALGGAALLTLYRPQVAVERPDLQPAASAPAGRELPPSKAVALPAASTLVPESPRSEARGLAREQDPERPAPRKAQRGLAGAGQVPKVNPSDELALLNAARIARRSAPQAALVLLQQHERDFPESTFREEREALLIELLMRSDPEKARARLVAFDQRYPHSAYRKALSSRRSDAD
jgi:hypothetical protein